MARTSGIIGSVLVLGVAALAQSGAGEALFSGSAGDEGHMSSQNPWSNDFEPSGPGEGVVYYRNCNDARSAGAAPIERGEPGYRPEMDGDNDGTACEPHRGRY